MPARKSSARKPSAKKSSGRKPTLSPTRIATYLECAVRYKYIYEDKIGRFFMRAKPGYSFGSTLHHVLQHFHAEGATHSAEELIVRMEQTWIGAGYATDEQEQAHREAGQQIVQAYHAAHQERLAGQVETIATEKTLSYDMDQFKLSGRIDRIDRHPDGSLEIIDYKSGRWETTSDEVAGDLAMCCYQLILKRLHPDARVFATIYCLRSGNQASAELSEEALDQFERDIRQIGAEILDRDFSQAEPVRKDICPECEFLPVCERFWRNKARRERLDVPPSPDGG